MKDLAALALVILPLGMTIVEILAAGDAPPAREPHDRDTGDRIHWLREAPAAPAAEESRPGTSGSVSRPVRGAPGEHAVLRKPA